MMSSRARGLTAWSGVLAAGLFTASLAGFAALRTDGYTHGTKAVSELGALGAPNALAFNILGFILPGVLVAVLAFGLHRMLSASGRAGSGPLLLALSGLLFACAGVFPVDMAARSSAVSVLHMAAAMGAGLLFSTAVFPLGATLRRQPGFTVLGRTTPWFVLFLAANIGWQGVWQATGWVLPGWGQRIAFAGFFLWAALAGWSLRKGSGTGAKGPGGAPVD
jgi:hypothetical membrane protein